MQFICVQGKGESLVARSVYDTVWYDEENGRKEIQNLVLRKYKLGFGDLKSTAYVREGILPLHHNTVLLKEPERYCNTRDSKISFGHRRKGCSTTRL